MPSQRHDFWDTQPITKIGKDDTKEGFIQDPATFEESKEGIQLPDNYEWYTVSLDN